MFYLFLLLGIPSTGINNNPVKEKVRPEKTIVMPSNDFILTLPKGWNTLLEEHFESGIPASWTVVSGNGDGYTWTPGKTSDLYGYTPPDYGTAYAYYSDDDAGYSAPASLPGEDLITPAIYTSPYSNIRVIFAYGNSYTWYGTDTFGVWIRTNTGGVWSDWVNQAYYPNQSFGWDTLDISNTKALYDSIQVMFRYLDHGGWEYAAGVDNVYILGEDILSHDVGVYSISSPPQFYLTNTFYDMTATYKNYGSSPETFNEYYEILDKDLMMVYSYWIPDVTLNPGDTIRSNFASISTGNYKKLLKRAWTVLSGDEQPLNDTLEQWIYADIDGYSYNSFPQLSPPIYARRNISYDVLENFANNGQVGDTFDITIEITNNGNTIFTGELLDFYIEGSSGYGRNWGPVQFPEYGTYQIKQIVSSPYDIRNANDTLIINGYVSDWEFITNMPIALMDHCVVFDGSKIYVFGGYNPNAGGGQTNLYIYDFNSKGWTTGASLPVDLRMGDACILGDTIYFPGGYSNSLGSIQDNLYKYSISGDNWTVSPGTGEPCWFYTCKPANGKVYKIGGYNAGTGTMYASTWEYDPSTGLWTKKADMPFACELMFGDVLNDTIYLVGGYDGANIMNESRFYDAVNNTWTMDNSIFAYYPIQAWGGGAAFFRDTFYCISGVNNSWALTDSVFYYDKGSNTWVLGSPVTRKVYRFDAVGVQFGKGEDGLYMLGGSVGGFTPIDSVFGIIPVATGVPEEPKDISIHFTSRIGPEVSFVINGNGNFNVSIFDITGRIVKKMNVPGRTPVILKGQEISKGVYFVKVDEIDKAFKIILLK